MSARTKARKRALDVMYAAEIQQAATTEVLATHEGSAQHEFNPYVEQIVTGVSQHSARIDELLETYSTGWSLDRMPDVDRNILRIGVWELLYTDVPDEAVISEAVALASDLSTDDSPKFVNGLLSKVSAVKEHLVLGDG